MKCLNSACRTAQLSNTKGILHLGEDLGLWGSPGPPCDVRIPWQLSVTSRQMMAVLPDPALPTMTAPRPSQVLVFLKTSSSLANSQSRPTKGVSAVIPGTSNSSGFSIMSVCLNGTSLPAHNERTEFTSFKSGSFYVPLSDGGNSMCVCMWKTENKYPEVKPQITFGVVTWASSCVVLSDGATLPCSPLVVQITQILQSSGACCCAERMGGK